MLKRKPISRRDFIKLGGVATGAALLAACAPATTPQLTSAAPTSVPPTVADPTAAATSTPLSLPWEHGIDLGSPSHKLGWKTDMPALPAGLGPDKKIEVQTIVGALGSSASVEGDTEDNNPFTRMSKKYLGIDWKATTDRGFVYADFADRDTKLNLAMASDNIPDLIPFTTADAWSKLLEADKVEDITDLWNSVIDPKIKDNLNYDNGIGWTYAKKDGRIMGIPYAQLVAQNNKVLWVRQDWLDKAGMSAPTTLEELEAVATAFVKGEFGQGAKGTTIGLLACTDIDNWYASLDPILGAFGVATSAAGNITDPWVKQADGSLGYSPIVSAPGMKAALELLAKWYKAGLINADFDIKKPWEVETLVESNQNGLHFTPYFSANWGIPGSITNDPKAKWTFADLPKGPDGKQGCHDSVWGGGVTAFRKGYGNVAEVLKYFNWMSEYWENPERRVVPGWEGWNYVWNDDNTIKAGPSNAFEPHSLFLGPLGFGSSCTDIFREYKRLKLLYENWAKLPKDQWDAWQIANLGDPNSTANLANKAYMHVVEKSPVYGIKNWFWAPPTATMVEKGSDIYVKEQTLIVSIIKGEKTPDAWDEYTKFWKDKDGEKITAEVNEWWQKFKS